MKDTLDFHEVYTSIDALVNSVVEGLEDLKVHQVEKKQHEKQKKLEKKEAKQVKKQKKESETA